MNKKIFLRSFIITNILFASIFIFINSKLNRDQEGFKSSIPTVTAEEIKKEKKYVVSVISYGCPGHPNFMPKLKENINLITDQGYKLFIVNDSQYSLDAEKNINKLAELYNIKESIYFIDPQTYPVNGGFFNTKTRYYDFVNKLSENTENLLMGYGYYLIFNNGELTYDGYSFSQELL